MVSSHALPATPLSGPRLPSLSLSNQNALTITQNIGALVNTLTADPNMQYMNSQMLSCEIAVEFFEHGDIPHDLEHSSNISDFRDIKCHFRYGGYVEDEKHSQFIVQNKFPQQWDQWALPVPAIITNPRPPGYVNLPFAWSDVETHMSLERADQLLKAAGHQPGEGFIGCYDYVKLRKRATNDLAWCFENVIGDYPDTSAIHTYLVSVSSGVVEQVLHYPSALHHINLTLRNTSPFIEWAFQHRSDPTTQRPDVWSKNGTIFQLCQQVKARNIALPCDIQASHIKEIGDRKLLAAHQEEVAMVFRREFAAKDSFNMIQRERITEMQNCLEYMKSGQ
ncbi:MAG: hypothetical protein Q9205_004979 [Flavoplaca limonia]